ncbi:hypothetical protein LUZ61_013083 [Rhynchospora tenuis]|uniref:Uncharacterized protein n=1 Tax=Rhynchospora tenuis TaxID=198213 RepID=A0AAD6F286_9POAL|nr:hypothetical protein LUZ61_013083 [Rhynchospora tenuis]
MAAAEARAVWQRAANRCFVQEDAKRAPKLPPPPPPCSSSSSSSLCSSASPPNTSTGSSQQSHCRHDDEDKNNNNAIDEHQQQLILNLTPLSRNPYPISTANLPPDTRWWLQLHPNFAYQREFLLYDPKSHPPYPATTHDPLPPSPDFDIAFDQLEVPNTSLSMSFTKHGNSNSTDRNGEDKKLSYNVKSYEDTLMLKKREPWWRVADGEDLASMVAEKTTQHVENCDLPRPTQTSCYSCGNLYPDPTMKVGMAAFGNAYYDDNNLPSRKIFPEGSQLPFWWDDKRRIECSTRLERQSNESEEEKGSREELLEALCHSQTRARQAEMVAKKAHREKEDIMKLLFRQASHLFACKQWLKMLQLENLCLQLRIRDHHVPFSSKLWSPPPTPPHNKPGKIPKGKNSICRYVVLVAVGWGLAGAGVLLGWTLGWLLPKL